MYCRLMTAKDDQGKKVKAGVPKPEEEDDGGRKRKRGAAALSAADVEEEEDEEEEWPKVRRKEELSGDWGMNVCMYLMYDRWNGWRWTGCGLNEW